MNPSEFAAFIVKICFLYCIIWFGLRTFKARIPPPIPDRLMKLSNSIANGKPHRRYWATLRAEPMFDDHYRKLPGRMSCTVLPFKSKGEQVWQLRVGFKETADSEPSKFISIPVYKNGQIYDV
jgi:hypothetical protein